MPDRILRASILSSDRVNTLSWGAEVFYRRLMSVADDYGRFDGRTSILRAHLFALKLDRVSESDVGKWIRECDEAGLVRLYEVDGKPFTEIQRFDQRNRAQKSKYPAPPCAPQAPAVNCRQLTATCGHPRPYADAETIIEGGCDVVSAPSAEGSAGGGSVAQQTDFLNPAQTPRTAPPPAVSTLAAPQIAPVAAERPPAPPPADPRHHEITSAWGPAFREAFGVDYQFSGRDAKTLKRWLATSRATADETLATARGAWDRAKVDRFARCCREAATIHGLCTYYNDVGVELKSPLQPPAGGPGTGRRMTFAG